MLFYTSPIPCIILGLIVLLHLLSVKCAERFSVAVVAVNVCLHGALAVAELAIGAALGEMTLLYAVSFLIYLVFAKCLLKSATDEERREEDDL